MERPRFKWCREAIEQIRFKPDRDKIWDELMAHIEDRCEALKESGLPEEEAETRSVAAMGDPEEVGKQLNSVHKPWLGWLWIVSKVLVILCLIVFVWNSMFTWQANYGYKRTMPEQYAEILREEGTEFPAEVTQLFYDEPGVSARMGDFTLTVEKVTLNRQEGMYDLVVALISIDGFLPWEEPVETLHFYVVDDLGNCYMPWGRPDTWDVRMQKYQGELYFGACSRTAATWSYWLEFFPEEDVEWFELRYDLDGRSMALRVDMTGGEAP